MNTIEPLTDQLIEAAFERRAARADRYDLGTLGAVIEARTGTMRQGRAWGLRLPAMRPIGTVRRAAWATVVIMAVLLGLVIAFVLIGQSPSTPFRTGLLAFVRAGDVYLANPDGSDAEVVLHQDGVAFLTVAWSPDGSRLAVDGESGAVVIDPVSGAATYIGGANPVWSPDGRQLGVIEPSTTGSTSIGSQLRIVDAATGAANRTYPFPAIGGLAWSADGRWIAATGGMSGRSNALVRIDVTTGHWSEVDGGSGMLDSAREPSWSPDSRRIAYIRWGAQDTAACHGTPLCATDVFVANADGSNPVQLNRVRGKADQPAWSPDGHWIAYRSVDHSAQQSGNGGTFVHRGTAIVIVHPDGTGERTIAAAGVDTFAWEPASDRLRFLATDTDSASTVWEASLDGAAHQLHVPIGPPTGGFERTGTWFGWQAVDADQAIGALPNVASRAPAAAISVVGPPLASPADPSGTWPTLATTSIDGCQPVTISSATGVMTTIANLCDTLVRVDTGRWAPTGLTFAAVRGGTLAIVDGNGHVTLNVARLAGLTSIAWAPDGSWLAVGTGTRSWILHPDGSGLREIEGDATWSANGHLTATTADGRLLVGPLDGSDMRGIGVFPIGSSWSSDGTRFAFVRDGNAWMANRDGTDPRNMTSLPLGGADNVAWSPDGRWIAVGMTHGFWLVPVNGGSKRWFDLGLGETVYDFAWSPGAGRLAVQSYTATAQVQRAFVYLVDPDGSPTVRLADLATPSWSPDGRFLAGGRAVGGSDDRTLVLMNADGSGARELPGSGGLDPFVWVRR